jgi:mRNA interferase RelE/StbE
VTYAIEFKPAAARDLKRLPLAAAKRVARAIDRLSTDPRPRGVKKLQGKREHAFFRLRVGDYWVINQVEDDRVVVLVVRIADRKDIYRLEL